MSVELLFAKLISLLKLFFMNLIHIGNILMFVLSYYKMVIDIKK